MAADTLSLVMRSMGDYSQALALNQEKIDWDSEHGVRHGAVGVALHARPDPEQMGNYDGAIAEFEKARTFSASLGDQQGIAFADQRMCEAHIELGQLAPAQRECSNALADFQAVAVRPIR